MGLEHNARDSAKPAVNHENQENSKLSDEFVNNVSITRPVFNKENYDPAKSPVRVDGPKLTDLHISSDNDTHYQELAVKGADFIAANGNINLQVKTALAEAHKEDKQQGTGYHQVDKLLSYMNHHLGGTDYSVTRDRDKIMVLDSTDNQSVKHDASGKALVKVRDDWNLHDKK